MKLCECGCGKEVTKEGNRYLYGHYWKGKKRPDITGDNNPAKRPEVRVNISENNPMKRFEIAAKVIGEKNGMYGKKHSEESCAKMRKRAAKRYSLKKWQEKYPLMCKVEEMKEENRKIWVHCTNHNCLNSKEKGGWFSVTNVQLSQRGRALHDSWSHYNFYCSDNCKETCTKFNKSAVVIQNEIEIVAGHIKDPVYTSEEYNTWREEVLRRQREEIGYNECEYCGNRNINELVVHHEKPQKTHPEMALDPDNGIIACGANSKKKCHYKYGHRTGTECSTGNLANKICI